MTTAHSETRSGIDLDHVDEGTRAQDDLFEHVNGRWLAEHEIPADRALDGAFRTLADKAEVDVRTIIGEAADSDAAPGTDAQKIGDLFTSFMDTDTIALPGSGRSPTNCRLSRVPPTAPHSHPCSDGCSGWVSAARSVTTSTPIRRTPSAI